MALIRYNPNHLFNGDFDRLFAGFWPLANAAGQQDHVAGFFPRVDLRESEDLIELNAEIPGVERESVKVEVLDRALTLSGEKKAEAETSEGGIYRSERSYGAFERRFTLPPSVDAEKIAASYENGVLKVRLPKKPEAKPRQIAVGGQGEKKKIAVS